MINGRRLLAIFKARNIEFFRDKSALAWNLAFPVLILIGFSFIFGGEQRPEYKIGVLGGDSPELAALPFHDTRFVEFVDYAEASEAERKLQQHRLDLLIDPATRQYWVNEESPKSYLAEQLLLGGSQDFQRTPMSGRPIRYVDWVVPGIIGMNMMFSCLFGVGYVIVRYRKNGVLKRLKATPVTALEFVSAQVLSRLLIVLVFSAVIYIGCDFLLDFYMAGSWLDLLLIAILGAFSLISLGLLVASRSQSEELTGGLLNFASWPMMFLSGVWFSLEGAPEWVQKIAELLPLTHLIDAARAIMSDGAGLAEISYQIAMLTGMSALFLVLAAVLFKWHPD